MGAFTNHDDEWHKQNDAAKRLDKAASGLSGKEKEIAKQAAKDIRKANGD